MTTGPSLRCLAVALVACSAAPPPVPPPTPTAQAPAASVVERPPLRGTCDASAGWWRGEQLWVADDERNDLLAFDGHGQLVQSVSLGRAFPAMAGKEADLEAVAEHGGHTWWVGSHDRGKGVAPKLARQRLVAHDGLRPGPLRTDLLQRLAAHAPTAAVLRQTEGHTSKHARGLSIEGLAGDDRGLWIGFRAPVIDGRALLVHVDDPAGQAVAGDPVWLDLGGRGVRALERVEGRYVIVAGPAAQEGDFALYTWTPGTPPERWLGPEALGDLRPEGLARRGDTLWLLSDDGGRPVDGTTCKKLPPEHRRARTATVAAPP